MNKTTPTPKTDKKTIKKETEKPGSSLLSANSSITITIKKEIVKKKYNEVLSNLSKKIKLDGFREGTVPAKIAEEHIGQAKVIEYVLEELVPDAYKKTIADSKKAPITRPEFSVTSTEIGKDWILEAHFAELPEVSIKKYETHVKAGAKNAKKALAETKKAAEEKTESKDGKEEKKVTPLTPEQEKETKLQHIFKEMVTQLKPKVPELLLKHETQHEFENISNQLKQLNMTVEDYLKRRNMTMDQISQELAVSTLSRLQLDLLLGAIAKEEKLQVTDKDKDSYLETIKDEKMREKMKNDTHHMSHLETSLLKQKVVDHLLSLA